MASVAAAITADVDVIYHLAAVVSSHAEADLDAGLSVPEDLSVVGIDGVPLSGQLPVSLSTVEQPHEAMVAKTVEFLMNRIEGDEEQPLQRAEFPTKFGQRESVGPAK